MPNFVKFGPEVWTPIAVTHILTDALTKVFIIIDTEEEMLNLFTLRLRKYFLL